MITELGGAVAVPNAVRKSDSTTTIRVNEVIMIRIDGAIDSTVNSAINWIARSVTPPPPWPRLMLISCASAGSASDPAAVRIKKNKTLRGEVAGLTKGSSDDPARTPSRLRDFRSRSSAERVWAQEARCGRYGQAAFPAPPAAPPVQPAGAGRLPAAAPFRPDSGRHSTARGPEGAQAAAEAPRRVQAPGPASHEPAKPHGQAAPLGLAVPRGRAAPREPAVPHHGLAVPWATRAAAVASVARCGQGAAGPVQGGR